MRFYFLLYFSFVYIVYWCKFAPTDTLLLILTRKNCPKEFFWMGGKWERPRDGLQTRVSRIAGHANDKSMSADRTWAVWAASHSGDMGIKKKTTSSIHIRSKYVSHVYLGFHNIRRRKQFMWGLIQPKFSVLYTIEKIQSRPDYFRF